MAQKNPRISLTRTTFGTTNCRLHHGEHVRKIQLFRRRPPPSSPERNHNADSISPLWRYGRAQEKRGGVPAADRREHRRGTQGKAYLRHHHASLTGTGRMAETVGRGSGSNGGHRSVLEAGVERAGGGVGGRLQTDAGQRAALQAGAGAEDRPEGCGVAGGVAATWADAGQFCAAAGDTTGARPDAREGEPDGRPHGGGQPVAEAAGGSQHQAVERGERCVGGIGPADVARVGEGQSKCR